MLKRDKAINAGLVFIVVLVLVALSFSVRVRPVADMVALLKKPGVAEAYQDAEVIKRVQVQPGVASVEADMTGQFLVVGYDSRSVKPEVLISAVGRTGYPYSVEKVWTAEQYEKMTRRDPAAVSGRTCKRGCCD